MLLADVLVEQLHALRSVLQITPPDPASVPPTWREDEALPIYVTYLNVLHLCVQNLADIVHSMLQDMQAKNDLSATTHVLEGHRALIGLAAATHSFLCEKLSSAKTASDCVQACIIVCVVCMCVQGANLIQGGRRIWQPTRTHSCSVGRAYEKLSEKTRIAANIFIQSGYAT
jgi:hypothetical protein